MTKEEILNKAIYIQYPLDNNDKYVSYIIDKDIYKLKPMLDKIAVYKNYPLNDHHYTLEYSYDYVLPFLNDILKFGYNKDDFEKIPYFDEANGNIFDLSYFKPKDDMKFNIFGFDDDSMVTQIILE